MVKYQLQKAEYDKTIVRDLKTDEERSWPYLPSVEEISYQEKFLDYVVDPETGDYYTLKRDADGKTIKTIFHKRNYQVKEKRRFRISLKQRYSDRL